MPLITNYEDTSRYTAPPDELPEEKRYTREQVMAYIDSCFPDEKNKKDYSVSDTLIYLKDCVDDINNEIWGLDTQK